MPPKKPKSKKTAEATAAPTKGRANSANIPAGERVRVNVTISVEQEAALYKKAQAVGIRAVTSYVYSLIAKDLQVEA